ncbi:helix-turn-helix domain-containing protein [Nocardia blacklockiae]|uniref:helix-turn-helix domain-containing protein n=1 Tax=Nocardia blacklockiae TaxID=480036 RepID=UPI0018940065|nr:helix-turn-helix transcriptional regulator [Nocardia blacklockiae]MBF6171060.1 helix-turn-helix domain-containing protein [Nocardia blacklockiae]
MPGNAQIGAVLRDLRRTRHLTLAAVARRAGCTEALLSQIETGRRTIHPWLAQQLDDIYCTDGVITALTRHTPTLDAPATPAAAADMLTVELPGGIPMLLSRRDLLTSLGLGITTSALFAQLDRAIPAIGADDATLTTFDNAYAGFQTAARILPPHRVIDEMTGRVALLEVLRRRADRTLRSRIFRMQARYAESLSWLAEESGNLRQAMYWIDRASQWGHAAGWQEIAAYGYVRRSMLSISTAHNGRQAVDNATVVEDMPGASPRIRGLAAKQAAFGFALCGDRDSSSRALDQAMRLLSQPARPADIILGQRSVVDDHLAVIFKTTCDIYLGRGASVVPILQPRLEALTGSSLRTATITRAKLARAYANAGQPTEAAETALGVLDAIQRVGSVSALSELQRALPILWRWRGRDDVGAVINRIQQLTPTSSTG